MIKNIFFDFFGVISCEIAPVWFEKYFSPADAKRLKEDIFSQADMGSISEDEVYLSIERVSGIPHEAIKADFYEMVEINKDMLDLISSLKDKYNIYLLSNAPKGFLRNILKSHELYPYFHKIFISSEANMKKPDIKFFEYAMRETSSKSDESIFIDDNKLNAIASRGAGMHGIHFISPDNLRKKLDKLLK